MSVESQVPRRQCRVPSAEYRVHGLRRVITTVRASAVLLLFLADGLLAQDRRSVILATTTSTQDTGLLDSLVPRFERQCSCKVKTIAVGTGQSLALAGRGEADVVLVSTKDGTVIENLTGGFDTDWESFAINSEFVAGRSVAFDPRGDHVGFFGRTGKGRSFFLVSASIAPATGP